MTTITSFTTHDVRFPTSLSGDGTDAMNKDCDYSSAYFKLFTSDINLTGCGMTFTIGKGNDIVLEAIKHVGNYLVGRRIDDLFEDMGAMWSSLVSNSQLRWLGPEKGVISLAVAAVANAVWDLYAKASKKPLWKLISDFTPQQLVKAASFKYITDALTEQEAIEMLESRQSGKHDREQLAIKEGLRAYTTSVGWMGYTIEKVQKLTKEALDQGFNHFKLKVGISIEDDLKRAKAIRDIIDDPKQQPKYINIDPKSIENKNAGPTGNVLMIDANQIWDVEEAIEYVKKLESCRPWFIEEPTFPDDVLGHAKIRNGLKDVNIGVATGEHCANRVMFKQFLQAQALDVLQLDSCRVASVNECLAIMLLAAKFNIPVNPHAGGIGLCEYVIHLSLIDYICIAPNYERNVIEWVDHLHEHFKYPVSVNGRGRYNTPMNPNGGYSIEMYEDSIEKFSFPNGSYWKNEHPKRLNELQHGRRQI